jgi:hypothetical protein
MNLRRTFPTLKEDAVFKHPRMPEVWITKITRSHVSFEAQVGPRRFARIKWSHEEFVLGKEGAL